MTKTFNGRVVVPGRIDAEALVTHGGFNTLASLRRQDLSSIKRERSRITITRNFTGN